MKEDLEKKRPDEVDPELVDDGIDDETEIDDAEEPASPDADDDTAP